MELQVLLEKYKAIHPETKEKKPNKQLQLLAEKELLIERAMNMIRQDFDMKYIAATLKLKKKDVKLAAQRLRDKESDVFLQRGRPSKINE